MVTTLESYSSPPTPLPAKLPSLAVYTACHIHWYRVYMGSSSQSASVLWPEATVAAMPGEPAKARSPVERLGSIIPPPVTTLSPLTYTLSYTLGPEPFLPLEVYVRFLSATCKGDVLLVGGDGARCGVNSKFFG